MAAKKLTKTHVGSMIFGLILILSLIFALPSLYLLATQIAVPTTGMYFGEIDVGYISNKDGDLCIDLGYRMMEGTIVLFPELKLHVFIDDQPIPRSQLEFSKIPIWFDPVWPDTDGVCVDHSLSPGKHQIRTIITRGFGDFEMRIGDFNVLEDGTIQRNY